MEPTARENGAAWSAPISNLSTLAEAKGICLVPSFFGTGEVDLEASRNGAPAGDPLEGLSDAQIIKVYVTQSSSRPVPELTASANKAAVRLGAEKLLKLGARLPRRVRVAFAHAAFANDWLPADMNTLEALGKGADPMTLLSCAERYNGIEFSVTVSDLTRWIGSGKDGLARVVHLWNMPVCPVGLVDHDVITGLNLGGDALVGAVDPKPRLSRKSADYLVSARPELAGLAVNYCAEQLPAATLVAYFDSAAVAVNGLKHPDYHLKPIVTAMQAGRVTKDVLVRFKEYLLACGLWVDAPLSKLVLAGLNVTDAELAVLVCTGEIFMTWLGDGYAANPANEETAVALAREIWQHGGISLIIAEAESRRERSGRVACLEHYDWLVPVVQSDGRAPGLLRGTLARRSVDPESLMAVIVKAAASSFAQANVDVQARLWRSLTAKQSIFDDEANSFDDVTEEYIRRDNVARKRVTAKKAR